VRISHWLTRLQNHRPARKTNRRVPQQTTESLEQRTLLTTVGILTGPTDLTIFVDDGDSATVQRNQTTGNVEVLDANGQAYTSIPTIQASLLTSLNIFADDADNTLSVAPVTSSEFSALSTIVIDAGDGDDVITGSDDFADSIDGGDGNDIITGGGGDDTLDAGDGNDLVTGGAGLDSILGGNGQDTINGGAGNDNIDAGDGQDLINGGTGDDTINAGDGLDTVNGGAGADSINGMSGADLLNGDADNDTILGGSENDIVNGGDGNDIVNGQAGNDTVNGDAGDDTGYGGGGRDIIFGGDGNDIVNGQSGNDTLLGEAGSDRAYGGRGDDSLDGGDGDDTLNGHGGDDTLAGGLGNDVVNGGSGNDLIQTFPLLAIGDVTVDPEGASGMASIVTFTVFLSEAVSDTISVTYSTADGSATAPADYVATSGTLTFPAGTTSQTISVVVNGDDFIESDENFFVNLSSTDDVTITDSQGEGLIVDDELGWVAQGPAPAINAQLAVAPNDPINGAIQTVAAHPTNADIVYIGAVNGGVWRTTDATSTSPTWTPLTDNFVSLSIGALEFDPTDATGQTLIAGIGRSSSFGGTGGIQSGLLYTTDGGNTWTELNSANLVGENILSVAARGNVLLAGSDPSAGFGGGMGSGLFRSTDGGASFQLVSGGATGLPTGRVIDLVGDPGNPSRFYAAVRGVGVFRSDDIGASWVNVTAGIMGIAATNERVEIAVHSSGGTNALYAAVLDGGSLTGIFRSTNMGATWTAMDVPPTGGQGAVHFSIAADPTNPNLVYVRGQAAGLFRGDASLATGSQFTSITGGAFGTPHVDSREAVFDANGDLIETNDGGVYRRSTPGGAGGVWSSIGGNLQVEEVHSISYDSVSDIITGGFQDNGTIHQLTPGSLIWDHISGGDGGDVIADDVSLAAMNQSIRYLSSQNLGGFRRQVYDSSNNLISQTAIDTTIVTDPQFVTPLELNAVDPSRLIIGGSGTVYETLDQGNSISIVSATVGVNGTFNGEPIAYGGFMGGVANPDVLYVGDGNTVNIRTTAGGTLGPTASPFPGQTIQNIILDPTNWMTAYVADRDQVFVTTNAGGSWAEITGNLTDTSLRAMTFVAGTTDSILVGGRNGVFQMQTAQPGIWNEFGLNLPNAPVFDLEYDATDDVLVAATMGRGVFLIANAGAATISTPVPGISGSTFITQGNDTIDGGSGNDTIRAGAGDDLIEGGSGNDLIDGRSGNDTIDGGDGNDTIDGGAGDDSIAGQSGDDVITGGAGIDNVVWNGIGNGSDTILASDGAETLTVQGDSGVNNYTIDSNSGLLRVAEGAASITVATSTTTINVNGGSDNDVITITSLADVNPLVLNVDGQGDNDTITAVDANIGQVRLFLNGGTGNDTITGSRDGDSISGDGGDDLVFGGLGNDSVDGGDGNDTLNGDAGNDFLVGNAGNDLMDGGVGNDLVTGGLGNDTAIGGEGDDTLLGGFGDDVLNGNSGNDLADGGRDNDQVLGGSGDDSLDGGTGDDTIRGQSGDDLIKGGDGNDNIRGDGGNDIIDAGDGDDDVDAGDGNDIATGGDGNDTLNGMSGADTLFGGNGNDNQLGGAGIDSLYGEEGDDSLNGGSSTDQFNGGEGVDVLVDPDAGEVDNNSLAIEVSVMQALALLNGF
jgi:Ca2+-binding RTX toxin-like protein